MCPSMSAKFQIVIIMANVLEVNVCVRRALAESFVKAFCVLETAQTMVFVSMVNASVSPIILARIAADWCQHYLVASVQIMEILTIQVNLAFAIKAGQCQIAQETKTAWTNYALFAKTDGQASTA